MQDYEVQKFRKRLKNHGYKNIRISVYNCDGIRCIYLSCVEPIFCTVLSGIISFSEICSLP